jgi:hypothetical protein
LTALSQEVQRGKQRIEQLFGLGRAASGFATVPVFAGYETNMRLHILEATRSGTTGQVHFFLNLGLISR